MLLWAGHPSPTACSLSRGITDIVKARTYARTIAGWQRSRSWASKPAICSAVEVRAYPTSISGLCLSRFVLGKQDILSGIALLMYAQRGDPQTSVTRWQSARLLRLIARLLRGPFASVLSGGCRKVR